MSLLDEAERLAAAQALSVFGAFHTAPGEDLPEGTGTLLMLGPREPGFWAQLTSSPEWADGTPDPVDRWSVRVIGAIAAILGGTALFPFGGPPHRPFYAWALRTGCAFVSPVTLLVHDRTGLMVSFRGAIALPGRLPLPPTLSRSPCETCEGQPCRTACPAGALTPSGYDVPRCHDYLDRPEGENCLSAGCLVRRACPISRAYGRLPEHSSYHMGLFHR